MMAGGGTSHTRQTLDEITAVKLGRGNMKNNSDQWKSSERWENKQNS